jgi:FKBP-type peptidyl-prolyl cis-trans isomerase FkpA
MLRSWAHLIAAWFERKGTHAARRRIRSRRRGHWRREASLVRQLEILESRELLSASVVAVHVSGNSISLSETRGGSTSDEMDFSVAYTSSQVTLSSTNGTEFRQAGQTESTDTINITAPASLTVQLNQHVNNVSISGDGSSNLANLNLRLGAGPQDNTITLDSVIANKVNVTGQRSNDSVTFNQSTINGNLNTNIRHSSGDTLDLESTTVQGNLTDKVGGLTLDQSTVSGSFRDTQSGKSSTLTTSDTTYTGAVSIHMGQSGVINLNSSDSGSNQFQSTVTVVGNPHNQTTVNEQTDAATFNVTPTYKHATVNNTGSPSPPSSPTLGTPTVNSQTVTTNSAPVITGTFDAVNTKTLTVTANGGTYTLGSSSQLTSPSSGNWSLDLGGATLTAPVSTITVTATDKSGNQKSGTGTITDGAGIINEYLTNNNLTAQFTSDGLAYVIQSAGSGAVPTAGQTLTVNYSGFLMNSNGTQGTEFDSNTDSSFGHVTPFTFTLGAGQVIAGWDEAFALLPVGTTAQLIIPSALGYGTSGSGSTIPPNSILIFDVTLISAT